MTKFNNEEFSLFKFILNQILASKKNSKEETFENIQQDPSSHVNYVGEIFYQEITYGGEPFLLIFKKHFIGSNPKQKYEKNFMERVNKFFDKDIFSTSFETHPYNWRRNFQDQVNKLTGGSTYDDLDKYNQESYVSGISVQIYEHGVPINLFDPGADIIDEDSSVYIQTNDIKKAKQNTEKYFIKVITKALDYILSKKNKLTNKVPSKQKKIK